MQQLTQHAFWLTSAVGAHCYWLDAGDRVAIIDPGMKAGLNRVARELRQAGRSPYEVTDILLTHYDIDHTGAAAEWQRRTGARAWLGAADAAILTGAVPPATSVPPVHLAHRTSPNCPATCACSTATRGCGPGSGRPAHPPGTPRATTPSTPTVSCSQGTRPAPATDASRRWPTS